MPRDAFIDRTPGPSADGSRVGGALGARAPFRRLHRTDPGPHTTSASWWSAADPHTTSASWRSAADPHTEHVFEPSATDRHG